MTIENATILIENASILTQSGTNPANDWFIVYGLPIIVAVITGAGVVVPIVTFWYQRKMARHAAVAEAFRMLNDVTHREARKVLYDIEEGREPREASYDIIGIMYKESNKDALVEISKDIMKNDFNEIGTLIHYRLLGEKMFVTENFWIILKAWNLSERDINDRRKRHSFDYMIRLEELAYEACKYADQDRYRIVHTKFCTGPKAPRNINAKKSGTI